MPKVIGVLVRRPGKLLLSGKVDVAVLKSIRRHLRKIKSIDEIALRSLNLQLKAIELLERIGTQVGTYGKMRNVLGRFNKYVAELLIVRDYDILKQVVPPQIAYLELQLAAHHIVKGSEYQKYAQAFQRLAKKVNNGWWTSYDTMPAMPLFQELHGLSPETLRIAHKMKTADLDEVINFSKKLDDFIDTGKKTGSFAELFELHQQFYRTHMNERFYKGKVFKGLGGKSLDEWFDDMIKLAREIDEEMTPKP